MKIANGNVHVKTERDIEKTLGIKTESTNPVRDSTPNLEASWQHTKQNLIEKVANLQTENQNNFINLKAKEAECAEQMNDIKNMKQQLAENKIAHSKEIDGLNSMLLKMKTEMLEQTTINEKTITLLNREIRKLNAHIKQLQKGLDSMSANHSDGDDNQDDTFEVEILLNHKKIKSGIQYLVRWKGYSPEEDSWVKESDLQCPNILKAYKNATGLK